MNSYTLTLVDRKGFTFDVEYLGRSATAVDLAVREHYPSYRIIRISRTPEWS